MAPLIEAAPNSRLLSEHHLLSNYSVESSLAAYINGEFISDHVFHHAFLRCSHGRSPGQVQAGSALEYAQLQQIAERQVLEHVLLLQLARYEGLTVSPAEIEAERRRQCKVSIAKVTGVGVSTELHEQLLREKIEQHITRHVPRPGAAEVEKVYRTDRNAYWQPEQVDAAQIFCRAESPEERLHASQKLHAAAAELEAGESFATVAATFSDCAGKATALGWIKRGELVEELEQALFLTLSGRHSPVLETVFGFHLVAVIRRQAARHQPLAEIRAVLSRRILEQRRQRLLAEVVQGAIRRARLDLVNETESLPCR